jgi:hypothetical protein
MAKAYYNIGMLLEKQGKSDEAATSYLKAVQKCE